MDVQVKCRATFYYTDNMYSIETVGDSDCSYGKRSGIQIKCIVTIVYSDNMFGKC
jgi:hypothetical protein